jgi:nucleoside-diphosphate-sugar epimerase
MFEAIKNEKILVTGGTGFLGRYLVEELMTKGLAPTVLSRDSQTKVFGEIGRNINIVKIDLLDFSSLKSFIESFRPDIIVHLAGYARPPENDLRFLDKFNFEATAKLLDLADAVKVKKIIMTGTADEYGFQDCPQSESLPAMPVSDYALSKNKAVNYALSLFEKNNLPVVILRPFTVYGIGQPAQMFISQAVECAVNGISFEMSKGLQKRDLLFITDFVNAIIKTLTAKGAEGEIFNVGSGEAIALRDVAEKIWEIAGAGKNTLKIGARPTKANELHDTQADVSKIRARLNWKPEISVEEGLKIVVERAKKNSNERQISAGKKS